MSRILLVDDSPHAQRMGERILSDEGYEVVAVSNADSALIRLDDVDPDVVVADAVMPGRTGYEVCQYLKMSPRHRHVRVILTAGVLETMDAARARQVEADGILNKPFEATALLAAVKPLAEAAAAARAAGIDPGAAAVRPLETPAPKVQAPFVAVVDDEQIRAAVTVALDASMAAMVDEISRRVLAALHTRKPETEAPARLAAPPLLAEPAPVKPPQPGPPEERHAAPVPSGLPHAEPVRRVTPLRLRSGSFLGLEIGRQELEPERPTPQLAPLEASLSPRPLATQPAVALPPAGQYSPPAPEAPPVPQPAAQPPVVPASPPASEAPSPASAPESLSAPNSTDSQPPAVESPSPPLPPSLAETSLLVHPSPPHAPEPPVASAPPPARPQPRVSLLRTRPGSIFGLDAYSPDPEEASTQPRDDS